MPSELFNHCSQVSNVSYYVFRVLAPSDVTTVAGSQDYHFHTEQNQNESEIDTQIKATSMLSYNADWTMSFTLELKAKK